MGSVVPRGRSVDADAEAEAAIVGYGHVGSWRG